MVNAQIRIVDLEFVRLKKGSQRIQNGGLADIVATNDDIDGIVK